MSWVFDVGLLAAILLLALAVLFIAARTIRRNDRELPGRKAPRGKNVARDVLSRHGVQGVRILEGDYDCYYPAARTIRLEHGRASRRSNATAAIAAHEAAHAVQHAQGWRSMRLTSALAVPAYLAGYAWFPVVALSHISGLSELQIVGYLLLALCATEATLRCWVEIGASRLAMRSLRRIDAAGVLDERAMREVLFVCGATYVVGALLELDSTRSSGRRQRHSDEPDHRGSEDSIGSDTQDPDLTGGDSPGSEPVGGGDFGGFGGGD